MATTVRVATNNITITKAPILSPFMTVSSNWLLSPTPIEAAGREEIAVPLVLNVAVLACGLPVEGSATGAGVPAVA